MSFLADRCISHVDDLKMILNVLHPRTPSQQRTTFGDKPTYRSLCEITASSNDESCWGHMRCDFTSPLSSSDKGFGHLVGCCGVLSHRRTATSLPWRLTDNSHNILDANPPSLQRYTQNAGLCASAQRRGQGRGCDLNFAGVRIPLAAASHTPDNFVLTLEDENYRHWASAIAADLVEGISLAGMHNYVTQGDWPVQVVFISDAAWNGENYNPLYFVLLVAGLLDGDSPGGVDRFCERSFSRWLFRELSRMRSRARGVV